MNEKHGLSVRGDSLYCPLPISYDSYWNCLTNCHHCYFRRLNHIWGAELRPTSPAALEKKLKNGLKNKNPKSILAHCLSRKKTIRIGNKTDPYQKIELKKGITKKAIKIFIKLKWSFVIQTRFTEVMLTQNYNDLENIGTLGNLMPVISPGLDKDWEILERKRTTKPEQRLKDIKSVPGINMGVNGEPFIPGFHTTKDFLRAIKLLKKYGIKSYNTYNFHFNDFVAKKLHHNTPLDIERIWYYNQDAQWKKILKSLLSIADRYDIKLGCPDFVNSGKNRIEPANTCCGIDVPNPCLMNTHYWKPLISKDMSFEDVKTLTFDGSGDEEMSEKIIKGTTQKFYTLKDAGVLDYKNKNIPVPTIISFKQKYKINDMTGCWEWTGAKIDNLYGVFSTGDSETELAHRWSYKQFIGNIPKDFYVCHKCGNPSCVNPDHLFVKTQKDNMRDCVKRKT